MKMKNIYIVAGALIFASGCAQLTVGRLHSKNETEWRGALLEVKNSESNILDQHPMSGAEKLGRIARNEAIAYPYGEETTYQLCVRKTAIGMLGEMLSSEDIYKNHNGRGSKGNGLTGFYDEEKVSELAFDQLIDIYAKVKDAELRNAVVKIFDNPTGYRLLMEAPEDGYRGFRSDKSVANVLDACSDARYSFMFDYYCAAGEGQLIDLNKDDSKGDPTERKMALVKTLNHNSRIENAPKLAGQAYLKIPNPTLEQSKKALVFCNEVKKKAAIDDKHGGVALALLGMNGLVDSDEPSDAQVLAASRVPEKDMRELLTGLREKDPKTYWFIWSKCATPEEAKKVYASKADNAKKLRAIGRLKDEKMLAEIVQGEQDEFTVAAIQAIHDVKIIEGVACDMNRGSDVRMAALKRLTDSELISVNQGVDVEAVIRAMLSFDYTMEFGDAYSVTMKNLAASDALAAVADKIKATARERARQIIADGESVKDETFVCKGFRPGMYKWEMKFLIRVFDVSGVGIERDSLEELNGIMNHRVDLKYVDNLVFWGNGIKDILGISAKTEKTVKDIFTEEHGDGGEQWDFRVTNDSDRGVTIRITAAKSSLPPRFKGREASPAERRLAREEAIQKNCEIKGELQEFFAGKAPPVRKGYVYEYPSYRSDAVVKQVVQDGIVVGRIKTHEIKEQHYSGGQTEYESVRYPNRIFIKTDAKHAEGDLLSGKPELFGETKYFKYIGTMGFQAADGGTLTLHAFEPFEMPIEAYK